MFNLLLFFFFLGYLAFKRDKYIKQLGRYGLCSNILTISEATQIKLDVLVMVR